MKKIPGCRLFNCKLTHEVIKYHDNGYEFDFNIGNNMALICVQDNTLFQKSEVYVIVVDQVFDFNSYSYKYIHTVETASGLRGLLVIEGIYGCINSCYNFTRSTYDAMRKIA